ncbi:hypothetical protein SDC9_157826 [bioreactor metagenome]|uniref:RNA polymerase sigma factor 70 region 4 type 2 domain-containing protein n=1 Tax=bioreactor metagenome TaxID=1076179 RepID=A0A645F8A2_9ZZZZ
MTIYVVLFIIFTIVLSSISCRWGLFSYCEEDGTKGRVGSYLGDPHLQAKKIVYYRFVGGLSLTEIAELENMDYQSVANIIYRAIKKIKKFYSRSD